jgi:toxin ParE1/3/4
LRTYRRSIDADEDVQQILSFTVDQWGATQAYIYYDGLERCFETLAHMSGTGRPCPSIMARLHRFEHESHVILYVIELDEIFIVRVLHKARRPHLAQFLNSLPEESG